ncbi:MAG: DUF5050 domain-containing protein [Clostridiales bacterium]|nr:DUF5050 domain-containing protein [Clostridiales bacterium]
MKTTKRIIGLLCALASLLTLCACAAESNEEATVLSTSGYIAEHNGIYYFANPDDEYKLYQMDANLENKVKLSDHPNYSEKIKIQIYRNKLYYTQTSLSWWSFSSKLYAYDLIARREIKVLNRDILSYTIYKNRIYFSTIYTNKIFSATLNGSDVRQFRNDRHMSHDIRVSEDHVYFGMDEGIFRMNLDGTNLQGDCLYPRALLVYNQDLYYIYAFKLNLRKINMNAIEYRSMPYEDISLSDKEVIDFAIAEDVLYFATEEDKIYKADLDGNNPMFIVNGSRPIVAGAYLFYYSEDGKMEHIHHP